LLKRDYQVSLSFGNAKSVDLLVEKMGPGSVVPLFYSIVEYRQPERVSFCP